MRKTMITLIAILTITFLSATAFSCGHSKEQYVHRGCELFNKTAGFNTLTEKQKNRLKTLHQTFIDETAEDRIAMINENSKLRVLLATTNPDRIKVNNISDKISDLMEEIQSKRIDFILEAKKISPDLNLGNFGCLRSLCSCGGELCNCKGCDQSGRKLNCPAYGSNTTRQ